MNPPIKKEVPQLWAVEYMDMVWTEYKYVDSFVEACRVASSLTYPYPQDFAVSEDNIRIVTPDNKIL